MAEVSAALMEQLNQAQNELAQQMVTGGPPVEEGQVQAQVKSGETFGAAGQGQAEHILDDHYFTSSVRRLWAYAGGGWRYANVTSAEEEGIAQVAFLATRVDVWWNDSNAITLMRCWKTF